MSCKNECTSCGCSWKWDSHKAPLTEANMWEDDMGVGCSGKYAVTLEKRLRASEGLNIRTLALLDAIPADERSEEDEKLRAEIMAHLADAMEHDNTKSVDYYGYASGSTMTTGEALEIVLEAAKLLGTRKMALQEATCTRGRAKAALNMVEDFIVNNFAEEEEDDSNLPEQKRLLLVYGRIISEMNRIRKLRGKEE